MSIPNKVQLLRKNKGRRIWWLSFVYENVTLRSGLLVNIRYNSDGRAAIDLKCQRTLYSDLSLVFTSRKIALRAQLARMSRVKRTYERHIELSTERAKQLEKEINKLKKSI